MLPDAESADYAAHTLRLGGRRVCFRVGRGPIQPFDLGDPVDVFVVSTRSGPHFGQFVFPKVARV